MMTNDVEHLLMCLLPFACLRKNVCSNPLSIFKLGLVFKKDLFIYLRVGGSMIGGRAEGEGEADSH